MPTETEMGNANMTTHRKQNATTPRCRTRHTLLAVAIASALISQAQAQDSTEESTELAPVTVTAQGREEDILNVPYNISAISGETIEELHILDTAELMRLIPGIGVVDRGARNSSVVNGIRIRGLNVDSSALGDYAVTAEPTVATYVDNVPIYANFLLSDLERVEVLRGPQGTLYGSGALGGAVRYITRAPQLDAFSGQVSLSGSGVDGSDGIGGSGTLTLNIPLSETWALRVNGMVNDFPGVTDYVNLYELDDQGIPVAPDGVLSETAAYRSKEDSDFVKQAYGRASLLWKPNDAVDLTLSYMAQADQFGGRRASTYGTDGYGRPYGDLEVGSIQAEPAARHVNLTSLEANFDLGFATLTSSTADYSQKGDITSENTGFYAQNGWLAAFYYNYPRPMATAERGYSDDAFIQEFRLVSSTGETFDWVAGFFYRDQDRSSSQDSYLRGFKQWWDAAYPTATGAVISDQDYLYRQEENFKESAIYGELTWNATDTLSLTGGFRYFDDEAKTNVQQTTGLYSSFNVSSTSVGNESNEGTLFKGNIAWTFSPDNMFYGTISEGYRRGGTNGMPTDGFFAEDPAWSLYKPDEVTNYELGFKGAVGRMTYNANLFYVDWTDPQINSATTNWGFFAVVNAESAATSGIELELAGSLGDGFTYGLGYTYTVAELTSDAVAPDGGFVLGVDGDTLPGVPEHRFNASAGYGFPLASGLMTIRGDAYTQSSTQNALSQSPRFRYTMGGFTIFNLSATYSQNNWDTTLWIKNIGNVEGITGVYTEEYMGTSPDQNYYGNGSKGLVTLPRTVGVTVGYRF